jgi:uncharacterized protein
MQWKNRPSRSRARVANRRGTPVLANRTCVSCRTRHSSGELLRLVHSDEGKVLLDPRGSFAGRGAWVCPRRSCLEKVQEKPGILRHGSRGASAQADGLLDQARSFHRTTLAAALLSAFRSGCLEAGFRSVSERLLMDDTVALVTTSDVSPRTLERCRRIGPGVSVFPIPVAATVVGGWLGRGPRSVLILRRGRPSTLALRELRRAIDLG